MAQLQVSSLLHTMQLAAVGGLDDAGAAVTFETKPGSVSLCLGITSVSQTKVDGAMVRDRVRDGGFLDSKTLKRLVRDWMVVAN